MKKNLIIMFLCLFIPFLTFAHESSPKPSDSLYSKSVNSLNEFSKKIESFIAPENAKEKGFWKWSRDLTNDFMSRVKDTTNRIIEFIENKKQKIFSLIENQIKEKKLENFWQIGKTYIKETINYIDKKIQN